MEKFLGKYRIATPLVTKTSNPIYLARSMTASQWNSVVKVFTSILLETPQEQDDFVQKVRVFMKHQHRSLLPILDVGIEQEHPHIVSKYASRGSLRRHLNQHTTLAIVDGIQIISQVGQALQYIHEHNLFHGNIKPENILFDEHAVALLADPAIPCILEEAYSSSHAHNIYYPQAELASQQSDQYALGCMAYELFTRQMLPAAIPLATTQELPSTENAPSNMLPEYIEMVLYKAMASDPAERYESVAAFIDALADVTIPATVPVSSSGIIVSSLTNSMEVVSGYSLAVGTPQQGRSPTVTKRTVGILLCLLVAVFASSLYFMQALQVRPAPHPLPIAAKPTVVAATAVVITATAVVPTPTQPVMIAHKVPIATRVPMPTPTFTPQPNPNPSPQPTIAASPQPQPTAVPMAPTPAPLPIQVQVNNPGFEAGNLSGWSCSFGASAITNFVFRGAYALQLSANLLRGSQCAQAIAVQPHHTYTLRAYVRGNAASFGVQGGPATSVSSSNYVLQSVQFTTGASTTNVTIYIANNRGGLFGSNVYADNFAVQ